MYVCMYACIYTHEQTNPPPRPRSGCPRSRVRGGLAILVPKNANSEANQTNYKTNTNNSLLCVYIYIYIYIHNYILAQAVLAQEVTSGLREPPERSPLRSKSTPRRPCGKSTSVSVRKPSSWRLARSRSGPPTSSTGSHLEAHRQSCNMERLDPEQSSPGAERRTEPLLHTGLHNSCCRKSGRWPRSSAPAHATAGDQGATAISIHSQPHATEERAL